MKYSSIELKRDQLVCDLERWMDFSLKPKVPFKL